MAHTQVIAEFTDADTARQAVIALERRGLIDANAVEVSGAADPRREQTRRSADDQVGLRVVTRAASGAVVGIVVGTLVGFGVPWLLGFDRAAVSIGAPLAAAIFCAALGAFWSVGSALPVGDGVVEAQGDGVRVVLDLDDSSDAAIRQVLEDHHATLR